MKYLLTVLIIFTNINLWAGSNSSGPDSPIVVGKITAVTGQKIEVQTKKHLRKLALSHKAKIFFVSFLGKKEELQVGYNLKGKASNGILSSLYVTLPLPEYKKHTAKMLNMSVKELFEMTDFDKSHSISYAELSTTIYRSEKHGPDGFNKLDKDQSGSLDLKEFANKLKSVNWWRLSQKTPEEWLKAADSDGNGTLSIKEFELLNDGDGHIESRFKKVDKNKSGNAELKEINTFIQTATLGK